MNIPIRLPAETWCLIFEFATFIPGIFSSTDEVAMVAFSRDAYNTCSSRRNRQSMLLKLNIGSVCSNWKHIASHLLFECISIKNGQQALQLAKLLQDTNSKGNPSGASTKTWRTKRIELVVDGVILWTTEHTQAVIQILQHCPNLTCFSTAFATSDPDLLYSPALVFALTRPRMNTKIKRIELKATPALFYTIVVALWSSLEVIWVLPSRRTPHEFTVQKQQLPRLHTFISEACDEPFGTCLELPALRTLISRNTGERISHILRSGKTLQYLSADSGTPFPYLRLCPSLQTLSLGINEINALCTRTKFSHSHIHTLVVECPDLFRLIFIKNRSHFAYRYLPNILHDFSNTNFPALKRIRFALDSASMDSFWLGPVPSIVLSLWKEWIEERRLQGISIEVSYSIELLSSDTWVPLTLDLVQEHL